MESIEYSEQAIAPEEQVEPTNTTSDDAIPSTSNNNTEAAQGKNKKRTYWEFLEHNGPVFPPPYKPLPGFISLKYDGKVVKLSQDAEEVAGFYAKMLDKTFATDPKFTTNFLSDWRKVMTPEERNLIKDLSKCDFENIKNHFKLMNEIERKKKKKAANERKKNKRNKQEKKTDPIYGFCTIDGKREKIKNYKIEPPCLFYPKGDSPRMGELKQRVKPEDVTINCSKDSNIPRQHNWKEVKHDNTVKWLASWTDNVQGKQKYIELDRTTDINQNTENEKYETARELHKHIDKIRQNYRADWDANDDIRNQRGVALYFIDKFAFRVGNEKTERDADTVGCCTLKVKHITLCGKNAIAFDFMGKASIRYKNNVTVEETVYKKIESIIKNKKEDDYIFDKLNSKSLNDYLERQMPNLTVKVFRTYNASVLFETRLGKFTPGFQTATEEDRTNYFKKVNFQVAKLLNHMRSKVDPSTSLERTANPNKKEQESDKVVAPQTSLSNYIDPRIAVAWCKKYVIPIEKVYTNKLCNEIEWAKNVDKDFVFCRK